METPFALKYPLPQTIAYYLEKHSAGIIANKKAAAPQGCPLLCR
jgi:hypothetical protein